MTTFRDVLARVDKSAENATHMDPDDLCQVLRLDSFDYSAYQKFNERVVGYWVTRWQCTDTWVGVTVYCLDGEPFAIGSKMARRQTEHYQFVSKAAMALVREFVLSLFDDQESPEVDLLDLDEEIEDTYHVNYASQIIDREGFHEGKSCTVHEIKESARLATESLVVKFEDGSKLEVPVKEFKLPIRIVDEKTPAG